MVFETIISCEEASKQLENPSWVFVDCRFQLNDKKQGNKNYLQSHIVGAVYADLDSDLSGKIVPNQTGRHPLPSKHDLVETISRLGISNDSQVVVYDDQAGQMAAARLWWLLKWAGHSCVAVLDGGFQFWNRLGLPVQSGHHQNKRTNFRAEFDDTLIVSAEDVLKKISDPNTVIVDSRAADRYRGENETIDVMAGHIPNAISAPFSENISTEGKLKTDKELKEQFERKIGDTPSEQPIFYCGSGVTAAQNILAYMYSGKGMPRLYAGSWSDWINQKDRPIETGGK